MYTWASSPAVYAGGGGSPLCYIYIAVITCVAAAIGGARPVFPSRPPCSAVNRPNWPRGTRASAEAALSLMTRFTECCLNCFFLLLILRRKRKWRGISTALFLLTKRFFSLWHVVLLQAFLHSAPLLLPAEHPYYCDVPSWSHGRGLTNSEL